MSLRSLVSAVIVSCLLVSIGPTSDAANPRISRQNPYRSFNLSGRNYGSVRWERQNGGQTHRSYRPVYGQRPASRLTVPSFGGVPRAVIQPGQRVWGTYPR